MAALGLLLLAAAAVVALAGIFTNTGSSHQLGRTVDLFGYHLQGSTGKLLLVGVVIGAVGMLGLNMLLAGIGRGFKRTVSHRKERKQTRRQTQSVVQDRDQLATELEREHAARVRAEKQAVAPAGPESARGRNRVTADRKSIDMPTDVVERPGAVQQSDTSRSL